MMNGRRTPDMFDRWAPTYDDMLKFSKDSFPFAGYDDILDRIVELATPTDGMRILDLGIGTGELAKRFVDYNCEIWGLDFSEQMLELAAKKIPSAILSELLIKAATEQSNEPVDFQGYEIIRQSLAVLRKHEGNSILSRPWPDRLLSDLK